LLAVAVPHQQSNAGCFSEVIGEMWTHIGCN